MNRELVTSSNIASIGYDADLGILEVEFVSGRIYQYDSVPQHVHMLLMRANAAGESVGKLFNELIKQAGFSYRQLRW